MRLFCFSFAFFVCFAGLVFLEAYNPHKRLKVIRIIARLNVGGPARHVVWLTQGLTEYDTTLVAGVVPPGEADMSYFAARHGVKPLIMKEMSREISPRDVVTIWKLFHLLRRVRPDIVHTHTAKAGTVGRVAGFLYRWLTPGVRCRFVHTYHGHIFHSYYGRLKTCLFLLIEQTLARFATDRIIVISPQQYEEIHQQFGVGRAAQFAVIRLGLDLRVFDAAPTRRHIVRQEIGANEATILVGIIGRLAEIKNHDMFLRAAVLFQEKYGTMADTRFVIIGDGHLRGALEQQAQALGLEERVIWLGSRQDAENFYPALDIVALTSHNEGTPLTLIEAMANGLPVISAKVGGVVDLLGATHSEDKFAVCERGVSIAPDDAAAFCEGLAYLVKNPALRASMGEQGRRFVLENYSKERLLQDIRNLYDELV